MALRSVDLTGTDVFEIDSDPGKGTPDATKFHFRRLSPRLEGWVKDKATSFTEGPDGAAEGHFEPNKAGIATVQIALTGWTNFSTHDGTPIPFTKRKMNVAGVTIEVPDQTAMDCLTLDWIRELSEKVSNRNAVTEEEVKPSEE